MISFWHFVPRTTSAVNICFQTIYARRSWGKKNPREGNGGYTDYEASGHRRVLIHQMVFLLQVNLNG